MAPDKEHANGAAAAAAGGVFGAWVMIMLYRGVVVVVPLRYLHTKYLSNFINLRESLE